MSNQRFIKDLLKDQYDELLKEAQGLKYFGLNVSDLSKDDLIVALMHFRKTQQAEAAFRARSGTFLAELRAAS